MRSHLFGDFVFENKIKRDKYMKRLIDIIGSLLLLLILFPVISITVLLIRQKLGSPVLFKQERPGLNEETFLCINFDP